MAWHLIVPLPGPMGITGKVVDASGNPIEGATVTLDSYVSDRTDANGMYGIQVIRPGTFNLTVVKEGYPTQTATVTVPMNEVVTQNFTMGVVPAKIPLAFLGVFALFAAGLFVLTRKR